MKAPVPSCLPSFSRTIAEWFRVSARSNRGFGFDNVKVTRSPAASIRACSRTASTLFSDAATRAAVSGVPSENAIPGRTAAERRPPDSSISGPVNRTGGAAPSPRGTA